MNNVDFALEYASCGLAVFPLHTPLKEGGCDCRNSKCKAVGKHPRTIAGLKDATTDTAKIKEWWAMWPMANVGIATGTGLLVIDVDKDKGGYETLKNLEMLHGVLPETLGSRTGGGGAHYLYSYPHDLKVQNSVSRLGEGIDIRADGGYIVAPPSLHKSGSKYEWALSGISIAKAPDWIVKESLKSRRPRAKASEKATPFAEGSRNDSLYRECCSLRSKGLARDEILAAALVINANRCVPPLDELEVGKIVDNASSHPAGHSHGDTLEWMRDCPRDRMGRPATTLAGCCYVLRNSPKFKGYLKYNEMRMLPFLGDKALEESEPDRIRELLETELGIVYQKEVVDDALLLVARENRINPVRDYLERVKSIKSTGAIERLAREVLGAEPGSIEETFVRKWLIGAVARPLNPGEKVDTALVLCGRQGLFKSTFFSALAGEWFSDTPMDLTNKDSRLQLQVAWIYEWAEIEAISTKYQASVVKNFLSSSKDNFRPPYERSSRLVPRAGVIVGTTNQKQFLRDETGNRRFWVIDITKPIDVRVVKEIRDAVWSEAIALYAAGEKWFLDSMEEEKRALVNEPHEETDPWEPVTLQWLGMPYTRKKFYRLSELMELVLGLLPRDMSKFAEMRFSKVVQKLGFTKRRVRVDGTPQWVYAMPGESLLE